MRRSKVKQNEISLGKASDQLRQTIGVLATSTGPHLFPESASPNILIGNHEGTSTLEIPHAADTTYLSHGYFRYIGKYPPQIVSWLINRHNITGMIVDPMCGGGTTLIEARLRGLDSVGIDVNPVSRVVSALVASPLPADRLDAEVAVFLKELCSRVAQTTTLFGGTPRRKARPLPLRFCREYFSTDTIQDIAEYLDLTESVPEDLRGAFKVALFAVLRRVSRANIKKMNLEIDESKRTIYALFDVVADQLREIARRNRDFSQWAQPADVTVREGEAAMTGLEEGSAGGIFLHPPYLTNTAFCEFTQLQLAIIGIDHKTVWKKELRCRGSFLHETDGLKKYLIGWARILEEAHRILRPGGILVTVVGDGQMDYVRIPIGSITLDFARDYGFRHMESYLHLLNNHTGQTQSRKMKGQHVAVFTRK